jgi:hypothetical protein
MSNLNIRFPVKDVACTGSESGEYYGRYYYRANPNPGAQASTFYIGKAALSIEDAMSHAETELNGVKEFYTVRTGRLLPAAATVLRLCSRHKKDGPTIEIVLNSITVSNNEIFEVEGKSWAEPVEENAGALASYAGIINRGPSARYIPVHDLTKINYLPHENYDSMKIDHTGVTSYRGGSTDPILFGLLGGEQILHVPVESDTRPDW